MSIPDVGDLLAGEPVHDHAVEMAYRLVGIAASNFRQRSAELRLLDLRRHADPQWFQHPQMLGYATYVDLFAGDLRGVAERADYLEELGVTYLHLLPLLKPRPGESDGGYAVMDYRSVRDDLGTI